MNHEDLHELKKLESALQSEKAFGVLISLDNRLQSLQRSAFAIIVLLAVFMGLFVGAVVSAAWIL